MTTTQLSPAPTQECGCPEFASSRRRFLQGAAVMTGAGVLTAAHGSAFTRVAFAGTGVATNVLVILSLRGGADGLSLVVPRNDLNYIAARKNIAVPDGLLKFTTDAFGMHPQMAPMATLWDAGKFAAVHAVGLSEPNRSHFDATEELEDADAGSEGRVGWLNRLIGLRAGDTPLQGVQMGSPIVPTSLYGDEPVLAVHRIDDMYLPASETGYKRRKKCLTEAWKDIDTTLGQGARSALVVSKKFEKLSDVLTEPQNGAVYLSGDLGTALAETARLLRADLGAQVVTVDSGSWDMHTSVGDHVTGTMANMVGALAGNLAAFFKDLGTLGDKVTVVTISEFGRRVAENANRGLDHGWANVMFLAGAGVKGGKYYAPQWPGVAPGALVDGDLAKAVDYRSVLSEVITSRFSADLATVFPGFKGSKIGCMRGI